MAAVQDAADELARIHAGNIEMTQARPISGGAWAAYGRLFV